MMGQGGGGHASSGQGDCFVHGKKVKMVSQALWDHCRDMTRVSMSSFGPIYCLIEQDLGYNTPSREKGHQPAARRKPG